MNFLHFLDPMDGSFLWLSEVSMAMFLGSMLAGLIPLKLSVSERKMRWVSIFGAGLLIGAAFTVIIPEGIETLYNARSEATSTRFNEITSEKRVQRAMNSTEIGHLRQKRHVHGHGAEGHNECEEGRTPHINAKVGFSLILGFVFMLLVDQMQNRPKGDRTSRGRMRISATLGLVVHSAVDGIAMGTSTFSSEKSLKWIVFFAIMLHKMPATFGLVAFLAAARMSVKRIWRHLTVLSLSAPLAAICTFWLVNWVSWLSSQAAIGCLMLFSAGTFMYVATIHVFPELGRQAIDDNLPESVPMVESAHSHSIGPKLTCHDVFFIILGAFLPGLSMLLIE